MIVHRLQASQSYFETLDNVGDEEKRHEYTAECLCPQGERCEKPENDYFKTLFTRTWSPMFSCDQQKRDVHFSDDPTEEDIKVFKQTRLLRHRSRRQVRNQISKENATRYCAERISETKIGKLCAKVGVDVQALVSVCSADIEVSYNPGFEI